MKVLQMGQKSPQDETNQSPQDEAIENLSDEAMKIVLQVRSKDKSHLNLKGIEKEREERCAYARLHFGIPPPVHIFGSNPTDMISNNLPVSKSNERVPFIKDQTWTNHTHGHTYITRYSHTNQMWKHHNTNVISTSQERTKQNKYFYHTSIWERRIETESFPQPRAKSSFQKQTQKNKKQTLQNSGDTMQRRAQ
jgi:hypothetical protein